MGMTNSLTFGGIDSADYGIFITGSGTFSAPERDVEFVSVPGRNGDLAIDNGRWNNIEVTYPANIPYDFDAKISAFRSEICRKRGYQRLEDTYHLDEFRMGVLTMGIQPEPIPLNRGGDFNLVFNCKPQRFLKSGEIPIQFMPVQMPTFRSQYLPVTLNGNLHGSIFVTAHCPTDGEVEVNIAQYDSDSTELTSTSGVQDDGETAEYVLGAGTDYWRIWVEDFTTTDDLWLEIKADTVYNSAPMTINAIMCRYYTLTNPTGYAASPLIECYGDMLPYFTWDNYRDGSLAYYYTFHTDSTGKTHFYMDCELQYLYDDSMNNLTSKLSLTTTGSEPLAGMVFPELGEEEIKLEMTYSTSYTSNGLGIINIYPRWWRL